MRIPVIKGVIDRRILVNYRMDPEVMASFFQHRSNLSWWAGLGLLVSV